MSDIYYIVNVEGAIVRDGTYLMVVRGSGETHAAGHLSFVGGKVEVAENADNVLEDTLRREIQEEVGVTVGKLAYVKSSHFVADDGDLVVDVIFLCQYEAGEPRIDDIEEVAAIHWLTAAEIMAHPAAQIWTRQGVELTEALRLRLGW